MTTQSSHSLIPLTGLTLFVLWLLLGQSSQALVKTDTQLLGEVETTNISALNFPLDARIDTGADNSSLDARNIKEYSYQSNLWVSFQTQDRSNGQLQELTLPLVRHVRIKRHGVSSQKRPVVCLQVAIGNICRTIEFTLTDRSQFDYPVLIGRNFLRDQVVVDISERYLGNVPIGDR